MSNVIDSFSTEGLKSLHELSKNIDILSTQDNEGRKCLESSISDRHSVTANYLLLYHCSNEDLTYENGKGESLLHLAADKNLPNVCDCLLSLESTTNTIDYEGNLPLHKACVHNNPVLTQSLVLSDNDPLLANGDGKSSLFLARSVGNLPVVNVLESAIKYLNPKEKSNDLPLKRALIKSAILPAIEISIITFLFLNFNLLFALAAIVSFHFLKTKKKLIFSFPLIFQGYHFGYERLSFFSSFTILTCLTWLFKIIPHSDSLLLKLFTILSLLLVLLFFLKIRKLDPGVISEQPQLTSEQYVNLVTNNEMNENEFCPVCKIRKPLRSKHVSAIGRCVSKYSHFSKTFRIFVGENNEREYFFLICLLTFVHFMFFLSFWIFITSYDEIPNNPFKFITFCREFSKVSRWVLFIFLFNFFVLAGELLHLRKISSHIGFNITNYEMENLGNLKYMFNSQNVLQNPFDAGAQINSNSFFFKTIDWSKIYKLTDLPKKYVHNLRLRELENSQIEQL
ncbi:protein s-acyltransferase [Anaeramoeba flamelloides]|uniref:Palmitoyltransferase n=1 Tax=Anaeramoeba flamelloides TaxID=1746091 RepID=A0AAV7YMM3_9EUKA|nr:protein s-acyltransferase [Anaeramoeba flamelloides]